MPPTLGNPVTGTPPPPAVEGIRPHLASRERTLRIEIAALAAVGLPVCLFGPLVLSSIYWLITLTWTGSFFVLVHWSWFFFAAVVLIVPLTFRTERRTRGRFLDQALIESRHDWPAFSTGFADVDAILRFAAAPRRPTAGIVELMLWGPRQVLDAADKLRRARAVAPADRALAADLLLRLCAADHLPTAPSPSAAVSRSEWYRVIAYLLAYDWIAISADGSRMWIHSDARRTFTAPR